MTWDGTCLRLGFAWDAERSDVLVGLAPGSEYAFSGTNMGVP